MPSLRALSGLSSFSVPRLRPLPWLIAGLFSAPAFAQQQPASPSQQGTQLAQARTPVLGTVIVSGSRSEQEAADLPASSEVLDRATLEAEQINDIRDAVRDLPNVSVRRQPARFTLAGTVPAGRDGNAGFNIRGLEGNRVLMLVDGVRTPRSYVFAANAFGREYFDIGLVERIEILKGPASALYGSDGLGGLVNFITRTPESFLRDGKTLGGSVSLSYSGDDNGWKTGATLAGRASDTVQWLLSGTVGRAHELENMGTNQASGASRTAPNPETGRSTALLGKLVITPNTWQKHTITLEHLDKSNRYELLSGRGPSTPATVTVLDLDAKTDMGRDRLGWEGRFQVGSALADNLQAVVSYQRADAREYAFEDRTTTDRARDVTYDETSWQLGLQADKTFRMAGGWAQKLTYGIDYARTDVQNLQTGLVPPAGETFPLKRFPDTRETTTALYLQDEFLFDQWSITPGVRYDRYQLDASQAGFNAVATSLSDSAVSPKLGVLFRATPQWSVYGNYASGFKAPNAFQVNNFFENATSGYRTIPNPNLRPERSRNFEVGVRGGTGIFSMDVAAFAGRYKDLIVDQAVVSGTGVPFVDPLVYQAINVGRARISGFEFKGTLDFREGGSGFSVPFSYGQTRGRDTTTGLALNSIDPRKFTAGVRYQAPAWSLGLTAVHHAAKSASDIDNTDVINSTRPANPAARQFATPSATTFDLEGQWRIRKDLRLNAAVVNLTDKKYWMWTDVRGLPSTSAVLDAYTQSGRHFNVSLVMDF